ncbi:DUF3054 domain-containing protein [Rhodococcus sp. SGAir0479]|uniref:DUF3054 domain-containing protein n=1 Tax=Rhodococcus sp. SGAir0479 TaxID=2567884 RepID=UPI0010CD3811|nr:DUF3054 domain-containing protein [Rhodococcus sp. SGAir0479]QCQ92630.1 DUF3054 domain-containing protein [Rhodococcus sp. SGAir0479]
MKKYLPAAVVDILFVLIFAALGRRSHEEALDVAGFATTAWPFLAGLAAGWLVTVGLYRDKFDPRLVVPTGVIAWLSTLVLGMVLRAASGQGTAFSFMLVAATFLALFLIGWRAIAQAVRKRRPARQT